VIIKNHDSFSSNIIRHILSLSSHADINTLSLSPSISISLTHTHTHLSSPVRHDTSSLSEVNHNPRLRVVLSDDKVLGVDLLYDGRHIPDTERRAVGFNHPYRGKEGERRC
jgi:hypothetical protein